MPAGLRRASAVVAIIALAAGGAKIVDDNTVAGSGFSAVATVAADPTGPGGPTGGPGMDGGQQFQPPQMPSSMPDYQGGNNQPPMDQNSGISIYNTGSPGAQQVPGQQGAQQPQQAQQPAHGTQIPDYQTATPYTQGPGKANPDYQAPQQNSPQQPQQGQQQPQQQQQPSRQQPQNQQDDTTQQLNQKQQQCQQLANATSGQRVTALVSTTAGGVGSILGGPGRDPVATDTNGCCPPQESPGEGKSWVDTAKQIGRCAWAVVDLGLTYGVPGGIGAGIVKLVEKAGPKVVKAVKEFVEQIDKIKAAVAGSGGGAMALAWAIVKSAELAKVAQEVFKMAIDYFVGPPKAFVEECFLAWR